jgi:hypothetical protein
MEQLQQRFPLWQAEDDQFFREWREDLPQLTEAEKAALDKYHHRYLHHREREELSEETVKLLLVSPLLELAGFYDEPFFIAAEPSLEIVIEERDEILRGRIDVLVIQRGLWVLIVESKRSLSFGAAIPQALAYMMGNPQTEQPVYGMVTDGDLFMFIKLANQQQLQYDFSDIFSLLVARKNKLYDILRILKRFAKLL